MVLESIHLAQIWKIKSHICQYSIGFMWSFFIVGTHYLYARHPQKVSQNLYLTVIFSIIMKCDAHAQFSKFLLIHISVFLSMLLK